MKPIRGLTQQHTWSIRFSFAAGIFASIAASAGFFLIFSYGLPIAITTMVLGLLAASLCQILTLRYTHSKNIQEKSTESVKNKMSIFNAYVYPSSALLMSVGVSGLAALFIMFLPPVVTMGIAGASIALFIASVASARAARPSVQEMKSNEDFLGRETVQPERSEGKWHRAVADMQNALRGIEAADPFQAKGFDGELADGQEAQGPNERIPGFTEQLPAMVQIFQSSVEATEEYFGQKQEKNSEKDYSKNRQALEFFKGRLEHYKELNDTFAATRKKFRQPAIGEERDGNGVVEEATPDASA